MNSSHQTIKPEVIKRAPVYAVLILVCMMWGGAFVSIKYLLRYFSPIQLVQMRYTLVAPVFLIIILTQSRKNLFPRIKKNIVALLFAALFGVIGYNLSLAYGETRIPSGTASLIINLSPVFTLTMSVLFLGEHFTFKKFGGMALSLFGLFILVHSGAADSPKKEYYLYALITLLAPISWALYTVLCKSLTKEFKSMILTGLGIFIGSIPLFFLFGSDEIQIMRSMPVKAWLTLCFLSFGCTAAGYSGWNYALRRLPSSEVASFVYMIPVSSVLLGHILLDEAITKWVIIGAAFLLGGIYIVNRSKEKK